LCVTPRTVFRWRSRFHRCQAWALPAGLPAQCGTSPGAPGHHVATTALCFGTPRAHVAASQRGLNRGLAGRQRTVSLRLHETIMMAPPPLASCYGRRGPPVCILITGKRAKRVLHGALNVRTGALVLRITAPWDHATHPYCLTMGRSQWRGWHIVLFEERGSPHTAAERREMAAALHIDLRFLPVASPGIACYGPSLAAGQRLGARRPSDCFDRYLGRYGLSVSARSASA
jgi:hypothetical protein